MQIPLLSLASIWAMYFTRMAPIVDLGYAKYQGNMNKATGNIEFLGVPYAAAPIGTPPPGLLRPLTNRVFTRGTQMEEASTT